MSNNLDTAKGLVLAALDDLNQQRPTSDQLPPDESTALSGPDARLDSLGLVTFIVGVEEKIQSQCGQIVSLSDEALLESDDGPLRSVGSLVRYIAAQLGGSGD